MFRRFLIAPFFVILLLTSCSFLQLEVPSYAEVDNQDQAEKNKIAKWTFIFYMCADNNLESAAIQDINEMEAAQFDESEINILALLDRSEFYDDSNGNWTGTRLLKISHDDAGVNNKIISPEIACEDLGISLGTEKELDMADYNNLSALLNFCCRNYAAEHYALIIWGHGTGYRSFQLSDFGTQTKVRAVAVDGSSGNFMETPNLRKAIESGMKRKLDFLGFDTCFASELEELYELRNCTLYFAGSEGTQSESGWDYKEWFSENIAACTDGLSLCRLLENQHIQKEDSTFAIIEMSKIEKVFTAFDSFAIQASHIVKNKSVGSEIKEKLFLQKRAFRVYNSMTNPLYLDICVDTYERILALGKTPTLDNFGQNREQIINRLLKQMDDDICQMVQCLCLLGTWTDYMAHDIVIG